MPTSSSFDISVYVNPIDSSGDDPYGNSIGKPPAALREYTGSTTNSDCVLVYF